MIRKRNEIDLEIRAEKSNLEITIDDSIKAEKRGEKDIAFLNKRLSELASETCFEDTFEGRIRALEDTAFGEIKNILSKLSEATGKEYRPESLSATSFGTLWHEALAKTIAAREFGGIS